MLLHRVDEVPGTEFPAGRRTRVLVGPNGPVAAQHFVMDHVTLYPGGAAPLHDHEQEEVYLIVTGSGVLRAGGESWDVGPGSYAYLAPGVPHQLEKRSDEHMIMVFMYAPKAIASHWQQERVNSLTHRDRPVRQDSILSCSVLADEPGGAARRTEER